MMCKISNGALVLLELLGWTLGPFKLLQASQRMAARDVDLVFVQIHIITWCHLLHLIALLCFAFMLLRLSQT